MTPPTASSGPYGGLTTRRTGMKATSRWCVRTP